MRNLAEPKVNFMPLDGLQILFWLCVAALVYIYAGYPLAVNLLARLCPRTVNKSEFTGTLSVVMATHNEGHRLAKKLDSIFASDTADQIVEVLVGSDGSEDDTADVLASYPDNRVRHRHFPERRGKPSVLNRLVTEARGDILIMTDARQELAADGIRKLVENFADDRVGVVSGELVFRQRDEVGQTTAAGEGVGFYWKYEKLIRKAESRLRSVPGATGAFYAIRRNLFKPIPETTLLDDVLIPMQAVQRGFRCLLEPGAYAYDEPSQSTKQESARKRRTIAGNAQLLLIRPSLFVPWQNPIWVEFMSHKIGRLISPVCLLLAFALNLLLFVQPVYQVILSIQGCFYISAFAGWLYQRYGRKSTLFGPSLMFVALNIATIAAMWDAIRGRFRATWTRVT